MDYQRLVSYMYYYTAGMKDANVGFAKATVYQDKFKLSICLNGIWSESLEKCGIYMIVKEKSYILIKLDNLELETGQVEYSGEFSPENINESGYSFSDICGLALANNGEAFVISMWNDDDISPGKLTFADKKIENMGHFEPEEEKVIEEKTEEIELKKSDTELKQKDEESDELENIYKRADYVDAFPDDYFYDCIEISLKNLQTMTFLDEDLMDNSFLLHGYYNFRHILFGRVRDNLDNTKYFVGVPGLYGNRERYMASMFGFNNFKRSHRSDYINPCFGYWYREI